MSENILVSICCVTYNHEKYIGKCLDGFVMQQTNFKFEILVHEDASTDSTAAILREYEQKYPQLFRNVYQTENQFKKQNTLTNILFKMAKGKYLALCEGDDYWTDPYKLQKQVDILNHHPNIVVVCHDATVVDDTNKEIESSAYAYPDHKRNFTSLELSKAIGNILTLTMCFRNVILPTPKEMNSVFFGDTFLTSHMGVFGSSYYIPEKMAAYRNSGTGVFSGSKVSNRLGNSIKTYKELAKYHRRRGDKELMNHFKIAASEQNRQHIYYSVEEKNLKQLLKALVDNYFLNKSHINKLSHFVVLKTALKISVSYVLEKSKELFFLLCNKLFG